MTDKKQSAVSRRLAGRSGIDAQNLSSVGDLNLNNTIASVASSVETINTILPTTTQKADNADRVLSGNLDPTNPGGWEARILDLENNPSGGGGGGIDPTDPTQPILIVDNFLIQPNGDPDGGGGFPSPYIHPAANTTVLNTNGLNILNTESEVDHNGIIIARLTSGNNFPVTLTLGQRDTSNICRLADLNSLYFILKTPNTLEHSIRIGLMDNFANSPSAEEIVFERLVGEANISVVTRTGGVETKTGTGVAYTANTWYTFKVAKTSSTTVDFTVNTTLINQTTNIPTGFLNVGIQVVGNNNSVDEDFKLDFFSLKLGDVTPVLPTGTTVEGTPNEVEVTSVGSVYTVGLPDNVTITGTLTANDILSKVSGPTVVDCKNTSGITLPKGTPVYISGTVGGSGVIEVQKSFNDNPATMPAIGLLYTEIVSNGFGHVVLLGSLSNVPTNIFTLGSTLYVDQTIGGNTIGLTQTRPTGVDQLVQNIGRVGRSQQNTGEILVTGAGRTNAIPNNVYLSNIVDGDPTNPTTSINFYEDFFGNSTESGETGTHGWTVLNGVVAQVTSELNHPGIIRFRGSTTANQVAFFSLSVASAINSFATLQLNMTNFIFKQVQTDTDTTRILGCVDSMNSITPLGVYIRKSVGSNDYYAVVKNALTENTALLFTQDTAWKNIKITKVGSNYEFRVNGNSPVTVSPPGGNMPGLLTIAVLHASNAAGLTRNVDLDFWSFKLSSMTR